MPLNPTTPALRLRAALAARLGNGATGFNPQLAAIATAAGLDAFSIDFSDDSGSFLHGKYAIQQILDDPDLDFPMLAIYQGRSRSYQAQNRYLIGQTFSGEISFGLDVFLVSAEGQSQSAFDRLVSCVHDAAVNAMNTSDGLIDFNSRAIVWGQDMEMGQPSRIYDQEMGRYYTQIPFVMRFELPNNS